MKRASRFWVEMRSPTGLAIEVEAESLRALTSQIRFLAATESARLVKRGEIPADSVMCARCEDLFVRDIGDGPPLCDDCLVDDAELRAPPVR